MKLADDLYIPCPLDDVDHTNPAIESFPCHHMGDNYAGWVAHDISLWAALKWLVQTLAAYEDLLHEPTAEE